MGVKFSSVVIVILCIFIIKVTVENFNQAQANSDRREIAQEMID